MGRVCSRCSSNLYPPQPGTSTVARDEPSTGTHHALSWIPSVLRNSTSLYPRPTDAGVASGDLRFGEVIHRTTSNPTPKYPADRVMRRMSIRPSIVRILLTVDGYTLRRCDAPQLKTYLPALGCERALAFTEAEDDTVVRGLAGDPAPGVLTFFVTEAVPRILVDCGFSFTLGWVDQQRQRVVPPLARVGRVGPHRNGRISLYVEGGLAQGCVRQDVDRPFEPLAAVVVEPGAFG